jgi:hypothetical protein
MGNRSMFVGLDVHKETIDVSIAEGDRGGEVRHYGAIKSDLEPLDKVVRALRAPNRRLHVVYEAGPCGFGIHRHLTSYGEDCVVKPSTRVYPERITPPVYPAHLEVRRVSSAGTFRLHAQQPFLSQVLRGEDIGLEEVGDGIWNIVYYSTLLGKIDERSLQITGAQ